MCFRQLHAHVPEERLQLVCQLPQPGLYVRANGSLIKLISSKSTACSAASIEALEPLPQSQPPSLGPRWDLRRLARASKKGAGDGDSGGTWLGGSLQPFCASARAAYTRADEPILGRPLARARGRAR
jgi:hypothetical protein